MVLFDIDYKHLWIDKKNLDSEGQISCVLETNERLEMCEEWHQNQSNLFSGLSLNDTHYMVVTTGGADSVKVTSNSMK